MIVIIVPLKINQSGEIENNDTNAWELQKPFVHPYLLRIKSDYLDLVVDKELVLIDILQPAIDVGNFPPSLSGGLTVDIDPINIKVWNANERKKATKTLLR